jgi:hypothetical protein
VAALIENDRHPGAIANFSPRWLTCEISGRDPECQFPLLVEDRIVDLFDQMIHEFSIAE